MKKSIGHYTFEEAKDIVKTGLAPMGEEYRGLLQEGFDNRWIDIYENEGKRSGVVYPSVAYEIGAKIQEVTGSEVRVTVPGHMQRGGEPCPYDRVLATRLGAAAAELIINEEYGYMAALKNNEITKVPLSEVAGKLKTVDPNCSMIKEAKRIGISFGDQ